MQAPLFPGIDQAILADLSAMPTSLADCLRMKQIQLDYYAFDFVFNLDLTTKAQDEQTVKNDVGYNFLLTNIDVAHFQPGRPPIIQIVDLTKQVNLFDGEGVSASGAFGPGFVGESTFGGDTFGHVLTEGGFNCYWFDQLANIKVIAKRSSPAAGKPLTAILRGWKFPKVRT